jgi:ribonuclease VapC
MTDVVVDSSAILAVIKSDLGAQRANDEARGGRMSALNYCEVVGWLAERGSSTAEIDNVVAPFNLTIEHFDNARALAAGVLKAKGRNISLADRACLALAIELGLPVITGDRVWRDLDVGVEVRMFR